RRSAAGSTILGDGGPSGPPAPCGRRRGRGVLPALRERTGGRAVMPSWLHPQSHRFVLAVATLVALSATPVVRALAVRLGVVARPTARSMHRVPVPHVGGLAIFAGFVAAVAVSLGWEDSDVVAVLLGGVVMLAVGLAD